jgi:hypothetical protein
MKQCPVRALAPFAGGLAEGERKLDSWRAPTKGSWMFLTYLMNFVFPRMKSSRPAYQSGPCAARADHKILKCPLNVRAKIDLPQT